MCVILIIALAVNEFDKIDSTIDEQHMTYILRMHEQCKDNISAIYHKHINSNSPSIIRRGSKIDNNKNNNSNDNNDNNSNIYTLTNTNINITNINNKRILVYALREAERHMKFLTAQLIKEKLVEFQ